MVGTPCQGYGSLGWAEGSEGKVGQGSVRGWGWLSPQSCDLSVGRGGSWGPCCIAVHSGLKAPLVSSRASSACLADASPSPLCSGSPCPLSPGDITSSKTLRGVAIPVPSGL